jgi:hypothetical protein
VANGAAKTSQNAACWLMTIRAGLQAIIALNKASWLSTRGREVIASRFTGTVIASAFAFGDARGRALGGATLRLAVFLRVVMTDPRSQEQPLSTPDVPSLPAKCVMVGCEHLEPSLRRCRPHTMNPLYRSRVVDIFTCANADQCDLPFLFANVRPFVAPATSLTPFEAANSGNMLVASAARASVEAALRITSPPSVIVPAAPM